MNLFDNNKLKICTDVSRSKNRSETFLGAETKYWVNLDGVDYLYKVDDRYKLGFGELFYSHMCHRLGIECVNCYPAEQKDENTKGVIVESFACNDKTNVPLEVFLNGSLHRKFVDVESHYNYYDFIKTMSAFQKQNGFAIKKGFTDKIRAMTLVDFVFGNEDRHLYNIELYLETLPSGQTFISLAPLFDNGMCMGLVQLYRGEWTKEHFKYMSIPCFAFYKQENKLRGAEPVEKVAYSYAKEIELDPKLKELCEKIKAIDIKAELEYINKIGNYGFEKSDIQFMADFVEYRLDILENILQKDFSYAQAWDDDEEWVNE